MLITRASRPVACPVTGSHRDTTSSPLADAAFRLLQALNFPLDWHGADQSTLTTWAATGSKTMRAAAQNWPVPNLGLGYSARDKIPEIIAGAALSPGGRALSYLWCARARSTAPPRPSLVPAALFPCSV